jgi:hypothetical protein
LPSRSLFDGNGAGEPEPSDFRASNELRISPSLIIVFSHLAIPQRLFK